MGLPHTQRAWTGPLIRHIAHIAALSVALTLLGCGSAGSAAAAADGVDTGALEVDVGSEAEVAAPDAGDDAEPGESADTASDADAVVDTDVGPPPPDYANWMRDLLVAHADRDVALVDIAFPRAHDAGTYELTWCSIGAVACNTQTQSLDMRAMLEAGVRGFDVRPMFAEDDYFAHHTISCGSLGCRGDTIRNMARQTRAFLDEHRELVTLEIGHLCETSASDSELWAIFAEELGPTLYTEDEPVDTPFIQRPLDEVIPPDGETGKVVLLWSGVSGSAEDRAKGQFPHSFIPRKGGWSNKQHLEDLVADQLARYEAFDHDGGHIFEFSWTMTMDSELAVNCIGDDIEDPRSIESMAAETNGALGPTLDGLIAEGAIAPGRIPHVLSVDYADTFVTEQSLRLSRLNLE